MPADEPLTPEEAAECLRSLPKLCEELGSSDEGLQLSAGRQIRRLLSIDDDPPIQEAVDAGVVPLLVDVLRHRSQSADLLFVAAWSLTNVCSGTPEQARAVVKCGGVPQLCLLLAHNSRLVADQAAWALGNLAADSAELRDVVLEAGALQMLVNTAESHECAVDLLRTCTWAAHNLVRHKPPPLLEQVACAVPALAAMCGHEDEEVASEACWALAAVSGGSSERAQVVAGSGCIGTMVKLLAAPSPSLAKPALRCVGNFVKANDSCTQGVVDAGGVAALLPLLEDPSDRIRGDACQVVAHIAAGTSDQIQAVLDSGLLARIVHVLDTDAPAVCDEALWTVINIATGGTPAQLAELVKAGAVPLLVEALELEGKRHNRMVIGALTGMSHLLHDEQLRREEASGGDTVDKSWRGTQPWLDEVVDCGGEQIMRRLWAHPCKRVYRRAVTILHDFFGDDEGSDAGGDDEADAGSGSSSDEDRKDGADTTCAMRPNATQTLVRPRSPVRPSRRSAQTDEQRMAAAGPGSTGIRLTGCGTAVSIRFG